MTEYYQNIKITCQNHLMKGKASKEHAWRHWKVKIVAVDDEQEKKGKLNNILDHVEYNLHPTFENPKRVFKKEPYLLQEKGWGEFDMNVELFFKDQTSKHIYFDLHFRQVSYSIHHQLVFKDPSPEFLMLLKQKVEPTEPNEIIIDHVYDEKDLENINPIHKQPLQDFIRESWDLPKGLNMFELAKRLSSIKSEYSNEIESIILNNKKQDMIIEENEDEFIVDLYSLGSNVLNLLWEYTEKVNSRSSSVISPFSLVQANTNIYD